MKKETETAATMAQVIGKTGKFHHAGMKFDIEVHDVRQSFGRTDYFIKPVNGSGEGWVSSASVTID